MKRRPRNEPTTDPHQVARARQAGRALGALLAIYVGLAWMIDPYFGETFARRPAAHVFVLLFSLGVVRPSNRLRNISGSTIKTEATEMAGLAAVLLIGPFGAVACLIITFAATVGRRPQPTHLVRGRQRLLIAKHLSTLVALVAPAVFAGAALWHVFPWLTHGPWPVEATHLAPSLVATAFAVLAMMPSLVAALVVANHVETGRLWPSSSAVVDLARVNLEEVRFLPMGVLVAVAWNESPLFGAAVASLVVAFMQKRQDQLAHRHIADSIISLLAAPSVQGQQILEKIGTVASELVPGLTVTHERNAASNPAALSFPMSPEGDRWLVAQTKPGGAGEVRPGDRKLLAALATVAGSVLHASSTTEAALHRARTDSLTGLLNREGLTAGLADVVDAGSAVVVFLDLDRFKSFNDAHGHLAGDEVLRHVARRLQGAVRGTDLASRLGGDEFVVVLSPCTDEPEARRLMVRLLDGLKAPISLRREDAPLHVGASAGAVWCPAGELRDLPRILEQADAAMYRSKRSGRPEFVSLEP